MNSLTCSISLDDELDAEEGQDIGQWSLLSCPSAHLRVWDVLFQAWLKDVKGMFLNSDG
jgi:hypothetical protein